MAIIFWLTGLSGSGKSTMAEGAIALLSKEEVKSKIIDGDDVRDAYPEKLGFSEEDIKKNNRYIIELCEKDRENFDCIFVPVISPYEDVRQEAKSKLGPDFYQVFMNADLASVQERDVKGLYAKAKTGEINNMIGMATSNPYQKPQAPDLILNSNSDGETPEESLQTFLTFIKDKLALK